MIHNQNERNGKVWNEEDVGNKRMGREKVIERKR